MGTEWGGMALHASLSSPTGHRLVGSPFPVMATLAAVAHLDLDRVSCPPNEDPRFPLGDWPWLLQGKSGISPTPGTPENSSRLLNSRFRVLTSKQPDSPPLPRRMSGRKFCQKLFLVCE